MFNNKTILIAPIDWGLGHTTRCVPLIQQLKKDNVVILGITQSTKFIFEQEFPELQKIELPTYGISYSKLLPAWLTLGLQFLKITRTIKTEHAELEKIISKYGIDVVISDNRFGCYNKHIISIYITHQLSIKAGALSFLANWWHHHYIKKYNEVWVPDFEEPQTCLAGDLSRTTKLMHVKYINPLSRLSKVNPTNNQAIDYLCLLSGPEPQRSMLEEHLINNALKSAKTITIVRGTTKLTTTSKLPDQITLINTPTANELSILITQAQVVICRSGYSSLMDMYHLRKQNLVLVPTPGQPEQEYLANYWKEKFGAKVLLQRQLKYFTF